MILKPLSKWIAVFSFFSLSGIVYLWPASRQIHEGLAVGIVSDNVTLPYHYWWVRQLATESPLHLLNGSLYTPQIGAPRGATLWIPYIERFFVLVSAPFSSAEQASFYFLLGIFGLAGTLSTLLGRKLGWSWILSLAFGVCITFTPFTFWRSQLHLALAAVYFTPLIGLAYFYFRQVKVNRDYLLPSFFIFLVATTAHYLILMALPMLAVLCAFAMEGKTFRQRCFVLLSFVPFVLALLWIRLGTPIPHPEQINQGAQGVGETIVMDRQHRRWDVGVYSAHPVDYFTGNYEPRSFDINPIRKWITTKVRDESTNWYPQERSSGIRWFLLIAFFLAWVFRKQIPEDQRKWIYFGAAVAGVSFLFSLPPRCIAPFGVGICPSIWFHELVPEMRAPNRWSVGVSFGVALSAFTLLFWWISSRINKNRRTLASIVVLALAVLEFPPTFSFPAHEPKPSLQRSEHCGLGVDLPYWYNDNVITYQSILALRETDCRIINDQRNLEVTKKYYSILSDEDLFRFAEDPKEWTKRAARASTLLDCLNVKWARLSDRYVSQAEQLCKDLGFISHRGPYCENRVRKDEAGCAN